jgi:prepilin-type N-terminal cleavage/methylation domain-containing protein
MCLRNREMKDGLMKPLNAHGFSLIEVLVAASVITLSLFSTVAFIRKGQELLMVDKHRRMARSIIGRTLENQPYRVENYNNLITTASSPPAADDERAGISGQVVRHRVVTAWVTWTEPGGGKDTVSIEQWLTNIQRD